MQFLPVYTIPFSFDIGLGLCLHVHVLGGRCGNFAFVLHSLRSSILLFGQGSHLGAKSEALREQELCKIVTKLTRYGERETTEDIFTWTDQEIELLLETVKAYSSQCSYEGKDWESIKSKYDKINEFFIERYPKESEEEFSKLSVLDRITKERVAAKVKQLRVKYKNAVDVGKRSGGGRIIMTYYDLCMDIPFNTFSHQTFALPGYSQNLFLLFFF